MGDEYKMDHCLLWSSTNISRHGQPLWHEMPLYLPRSHQPGRENISWPYHVLSGGNLYWQGSVICCVWFLIPQPNLIQVYLHIPPSRDYPFIQHAISLYAGAVLTPTCLKTPWSREDCIVTTQRVRLQWVRRFSWLSFLVSTTEERQHSGILNTSNHCKSNNLGFS